MVADPVIVFNAERRIVYRNAAAGALPWELLSLQIDDALDATEPLVFNAPWGRSYRMRAARMGVGGVVVSLEDRTEVAESEDAAAEGMAELEEVHQNFERLIHGFSHDMQGPIGSIRIYGELLERESAGQLGEDGRQQLAAIREAGDRLGSLFASLLEYSRALTAKVGGEAVNANSVVTAAAESLRETTHAVQGSVVWDELPTVVFDAGQLRQVFMHLIRNAIQFRREGVAPKVHISASLGDGEWLFQVKDNGIGIEREDRELIFTPFHRSAAPRSLRGAGIGLATVKKIIERHVGRIWVESEPGEGARICFTVPR